MINNSMFITNSGIDQFSGGGIVSYNLIKALQQCSELKCILSNQKFKDNKYNGIPAFSLNHLDYGYTPPKNQPPWRPTPFFQDYIAYNHIPDEPIELVQTYACPFGLTIEKLKKNNFCKIVADLAPHNIDISKEEHIRFTKEYPFPHLTDPWLLKLYMRHLCLADVVVVHSHSSADYIKKTADLKNDPVVIPHGCNLPTEIPVFPERFTPGYFGALGIDKGISYLIDGWLNCPLNKDLQLLIGGRGTEAFKIPEPYASRFKTIGGVAEISEFYKQISIYIQPSIQDGFGITPLEAMAYGRPVIVSNGAGVSELVTDGKDGFVVPMRDIKAIRDKIMYYYDNPSEIKRMGQEARKTAEKYTWKQVLGEYVDLWQRI